MASSNSKPDPSTLIPKIDMHSHFVPSFYRDALVSAGIVHPDGMPGIPTWTEQLHLDFHSNLNVHKSILSITSPGTHLTPGDDASARKLTRQVNEYAADLKRRRPESFGFFASLPLPDVQGSLDEIRYCIEHLNPDGFAVESNHHGIYVGDPLFDPVFDELDKIGAIVFIHPSTPMCRVAGTHGGVHGNSPMNRNRNQNENQDQRTEDSSQHERARPRPDQMTPANPLSAMFPSPIFEFFFDTARAYILLFSLGTISRCPNITYVVSHAGGCLPPLITRFATAPGLLKLPGTDQAVTPEYVKEKLRSEMFYFDIAGWVFPDQIWGIVRFLDATVGVCDGNGSGNGSGAKSTVQKKGDRGADRFVYGSDFNWTPYPGVEKLVHEMEAGVEGVWGDGKGRARDMWMDNANRLLNVKGNLGTRRK